MNVPSYNQDWLVLNWVEEAVKEGKAFLEHQIGYDEVDESISYIQGDQKVLRSKDLSNFYSNRLGKIVTDNVASVTNVKPFYNYATQNDAFAQQAHILNNLTKAWWLTRFADIKIGSAYQLAAPVGASYLYLVWNPNLQGGRGDLDIKPLDGRDVIPIRPSNSISIQDSMGVIIQEIWTINELQSKFGKKAAGIKPDNDITFRRSPRSSLFGRVMSNLRSAAVDVLTRSEVKNQKFKVPGKEVRTVFLKDSTINTTERTIKMGYDEETGEPYSWSYDVAPGEPLYPRGRMIICTRDRILWDGPTVWWFDKFPLVKIPLDLSFVYPNCWFSKSMTKDLIPHQQMLNEMLNGLIDWLRKAVRPNVFADSRSIPEKQFRQYDPRKSGQKIRGRFALGGPPVVFEEVPQIPPQLNGFIEFLIKDTEYLSGVIDWNSMLQDKQMPSMEGFEAIWQAMSPLTRLRGRLLEYALSELAEMMKMGFMQYYDVRRRVAILGEDGLTLEDFDFDPDNFIPDGRGIVRDRVSGEETRLDEFAGKPRHERAQVLGSSLHFYVTPNSMLEMALMSKRAAAMMLRRQGDLDHDTLLEILEFPKEKINQRLNNELDQKIAMAQQMMEGKAGRPPVFRQPGNFEKKGDGRAVLSTS